MPICIGMLLFGCATSNVPVEKKQAKTLKPPVKPLKAVSKEKEFGIRIAYPIVYNNYTRQLIEKRNAEDSFVEVFLRHKSNGEIKKVETIGSNWTTAYFSNSGYGEHLLVEDLDFDLPFGLKRNNHVIGIKAKLPSGYTYQSPFNIPIGKSDIKSKVYFPIVLDSDQKLPEGTSINYNFRGDDITTKVALADPQGFIEIPWGAGLAFPLKITSNNSCEGVEIWHHSLKSQFKFRDFNDFIIPVSDLPTDDVFSLERGFEYDLAVRKTGFPDSVIVKALQNLENKGFDLLHNGEILFSSPTLKGSWESVELKNLTGIENECDKYQIKLHLDFHSKKLKDLDLNIILDSKKQTAVELSAMTDLLSIEQKIKVTVSDIRVHKTNQLVAPIDLYVSSPALNDQGLWIEPLKIGENTINLNLRSNPTTNEYSFILFKLVAGYGFITSYQSLQYAKLDPGGEKQIILTLAHYTDYLDRDAFQIISQSSVLDEIPNSCSSLILQSHTRNELFFEGKVEPQWLILRKGGVKAEGGKLIFDCNLPYAYNLQNKSSKTIADHLLVDKVFPFVFESAEFLRELGQFNSAQVKVSYQIKEFGNEKSKAQEQELSITYKKKDLIAWTENLITDVDLLEKSLVLINGRRSSLRLQ